MSLKIEICHIDGDQPFVCSAWGKITGWMIEEIERDLSDELPLEFEKNGSGTYTFEVTRFNGQYGEYGRCEVPPHFELHFQSFTSIDDSLAELDREPQR